MDSNKTYFNIPDPFGLSKDERYRVYVNSEVFVGVFIFFLIACLIIQCAANIMQCCKKKQAGLRMDVEANSMQLSGEKNNIRK